MEWRIKLESKTGWGEVTEVEIATVTRRVTAATDEDIGLSLAESKAILSTLQRTMVRAQIDEYIACAQICRNCLGFLPIRDRRTRKIQTLFGTVEVCAPRIRACACVNHLGLRGLSISPLAELLPDRCTPELCRVQAELGARTSYREASRVMSSLLPCSPPKHSSISNRLARVAAGLDARDREMTRQSRLPPQTNEKGNTIAPPVTVILDGAHIRAVPTTQSRLVDVTVGKVLAADGTSRRFGLAPRGAAAPSATLRAALLAQGWQAGSAVTVISDGEPALRNLVKAATGEEVTHILDWWHLSIRVRHIEQTVQGMEASETPVHPTILDAAIQAERLRHLLWNGYADEASRELFSLLSRADAIAEFAKPAHQERARKLWGHCNELKTYIENNEGAIINYSRRYRSKEPVASAPAEGCVDEIANVRMAKKRRMRWSPKGAHRVATVRAAMLDTRLPRQIITSRSAA